MCVYSLSTACDTCSENNTIITIFYKILSLNPKMNKPQDAKKKREKKKKEVLIHERDDA